ncbi:MAG: hypothetical protein KIS74_11720 [Burkholderiales bacterium]|nr:hypothetical protein [Burkholderiales bacterium]
MTLLASPARPLARFARFACLATIAVAAAAAVAQSPSQPGPPRDPMRFFDTPPAPPAAPLRAQCPACEPAERTLEEAQAAQKAGHDENLRLYRAEKGLESDLQSATWDVEFAEKSIRQIHETLGRLGQDTLLGIPVHSDAIAHWERELEAAKERLKAKQEARERAERELQSARARREAHIATLREVDRRAEQARNDLIACNRERCRAAAPQQQQPGNFAPGKPAGPLAPPKPAQAPPPPPTGAADAGLDLSGVPDELLTPEGRRQKEQLRRGAGAPPATGLPGTGLAPGNTPPPDTRAVDDAKSLLDTVEPIIPRANADLQAIQGHAEAILALSTACTQARCPVVKECAAAARLAQAMVDAETYLDAALGALNRAAAASAAAHSNVVAQTRITSVNLDRAIRVLALQEYLYKLSTMLFDIASLADDIKNMADKDTLAPGDNWAAKIDGFYETAKDLESVINDGAKLGFELGAGDPNLAQGGAVSNATGSIFGTNDARTSIANDMKSSLSDAANAFDEARAKIKEAEKAGTKLNPKDLLGGLAKAASKIVYRDLKVAVEKQMAENKAYIEELQRNLSAEERILADLFVQRVRIGERRNVAEDALRKVRAAKAALLACLARACGNPTLSRPRLPDYYAPPAGLSADVMAKYFGWGTALRDLNPKIAATEMALRERFQVLDSCPGGGGGTFTDPGRGGVGVIPGHGDGGRPGLRAACPECQDKADRVAAIVAEIDFLRGEIARLEANARRVAELQQQLARTEVRLRDLDRRRAALRERIRGSLLRDIEAQQDLAVLDGERVLVVGELGYLRREIERLQVDRAQVGRLRDRLDAVVPQQGPALDALADCEARLCRAVQVDTVILIGGTNPFDPDHPVGTGGTSPPVTPPPAGGAGTLQFSASTYGGAEGGAVLVTVTRSGGSRGTVSVGYLSSAGTATEGADFAAAFGRLSWNDGDATPKSFSIALVDDTLVEGTETFTITLLDAQGGAAVGSPAFATVSIADNDSPPTPQPAGSIQFSASSYSTAEGQGTVTITATRTGGTGGTVSVQYFTGPSSATAGSDYQPVSGSLVWEGGDATPKSFSVPILDDSVVEGPETFFVTLNSPTGGATLGAPATATVTIADNDVATGPCGPSGSAWQANAGAAYVCSGNCNPCPSPQTVTVNGDKVTVSPFHAGGAATFTGCSASLPSDSATLTYFGQSNHRATITRTGNNAFNASIVSSGGGTCSMSCFRAGP